MAWRARAFGLLVGAGVGAIGLAMFAPKRDPAQERQASVDDSQVESPHVMTPAPPRAPTTLAPVAPVQPSDAQLRTAVIAAPGVDAWRAMSQSLAAHDPQMERQLGERMSKIKAVLFTPRTAACGQSAAQATGRAWMLNGVVAIDLRLAGDRALVTGLHFPPNAANTSVGDEAFQSCFSNAVIGSEISCPGCKPGEVTIPFPIGLKPYFPTTKPRSTATADAALGP